MVNNGETVESIPFKGSTVYLMAQPDFGSGKSTFAYSADNQSYTQLGNTLDMQFRLTVFTGNKYMLFNYATESLGGYVDVDWFRVDPSIKYLPEEGH